jgi:hypothetical protein
MNTIYSFLKLATLLIICSSLASCDDVKVYGSVGYSNYNGYGGHHGGYGSSVRVGGRIY